MITNEEYFNHPDFKFEDIEKRLEEVINKGIERYGEAYIKLDSEFEAGKVSVWEEWDSGKGLNIGKATINLRYAKELIRRCEQAGLSHYECGDSSRDKVCTRLYIYVEP